MEKYRAGLTERMTDVAEKNLSFEQSMARLEEIVSLLERGEAPLEQSLELFEEGSKLLRQCTGMLDKAEQKVTLLTASGEVPFDNAEETV